jgi:hypothetical protein
VILQAYWRGETRNITIPDEAIEENASNDFLLGLSFYWGQNDFACQADLDQRLPSLHPGYVVKLPDGSFHLCRPSGWKQLPEGTTKESLPADRNALELFLEDLAG